MRRLWNAFFKPRQRWRGFNLTDLISLRSTGQFRFDDLKLVRDWGFNFARLPLNYRLWGAPDDLFSFDESTFELLDKIVTAARAVHVHLSLSFHRAPGFTVSREGPEPLNLWRDPVAQQAFIWHWSQFARRYAGIPAEELSFNLINEPPAISVRMSRRDHERVIRAAVSAIREIDPGRMLVIDGLQWGRLPLFEMTDLGAIQSCRGYDPASVTHPHFNGQGRPESPKLTWPYRNHRGQVWNRRTLEIYYAPWRELARRGTIAHCGEMGCSSLTAHPVALAWLEDLLSVLGDAGIGWAVWNLRGPYGVLDSGRSDVPYHQTRAGDLDARLLALLQAH